MNLKQIPWPKLKRPAAYAALGLFCFVLFLFITFPYETLKQLIVTQAQDQGFTVRMRSLGPGFFALSADGVQVSRAEGPDGKPQEPLRIDSVSLRPSLWPLGVSVSADVLGGSVHGAVGGVFGTSVRLSASKLNLSKGNLKGFSGLDLDGTLDGDLSLDVPSGRDKQPDLAQASGTVALNLDGVTLRGGTVTVPMYGQMTPLDLPRIKLGSVEAAVRFDKGQGTVERLAGRGGDLDLLVSGTLTLANQLPYSQANLQVKLKAQPELMKNGFIGMGVSALPPDRSDPGFRSARISGLLGSPNFMPGT